jgi:transcriptional regulator with XRE-family HTH domain
MQTDEQKKVLEALREFAAANHRSFASIAKQLGVTQNTISNWKKGSPISVRNQERIIKMIGMETKTEVCSLNGCSCRNSNNPILASLVSVLGDLPERDIAKLYAFALELRDSQGQYRYVSAPVLKASEESAPFNKF